jgi:hypothetical protein
MTLKKAQETYLLSFFYKFCPFYRYLINFEDVTGRSPGILDKLQPSWRVIMGLL